MKINQFAFYSWTVKWLSRKEWRNAVHDKGKILNRMNEFCGIILKSFTFRPSEGIFKVMV